MAQMATLSLVLVGWATAVTAQPSAPASPTMVVDRHIAAYSARDIDAFMATYAPDAVIHILVGNMDLRGAAAIRALYGRSFADRAERRHIELRGRLTFGPFVVDHEVIADKKAEALATYRVEGGLIREVWIHQVPPDQK